MARLDDGSPPLVGRERERERLQSLLTLVRAGQPSFVLLGGAAGIGKSTLIDALAAEWRTQQTVVLTGRCYDLTATPPYGPWLEMLHAAASLSTLPATEREHADLSDVRDQGDLIEHVWSTLTGLAARHAVVLVLEDLHWADQASLDLLLVIGRKASHANVHLPLCLIASYRDDELSRPQPLFQMLPALVRDAQAERISLLPFDVHDAEAFIRSHHALADADAARLVEYLLGRSEGNPFFMSELLRSMADAQLIRQTDDGWRVADLQLVQVPPLVRQMIDTRVARLSPTAQTALSSASIIGQDVDVDLWGVVSELGVEQLAAIVDEAIDAHVLEERPGQAGFGFRHALIREAIYEGVPLMRRRSLHRRVAEGLMATPGPDPDAVAYHLEQANDTRLVDWCIRSGERAQQRFVWAMAVERFERAQLLLENDPQRISERAWLLFRIGLLLRNSDFQNSLAYLDEASRIARTLDDPVLYHLACAHHGLVLSNTHVLGPSLREMEASVLALETLDDEQRAVFQRIETNLAAILGIQGRGTLALKLAETGRFREARALLAGWDAAVREASADAHRATGVIEAYLGAPERARQAFRRSQLQYLARRDQSQAGDDLFHTYLNVQIPYAADRVDERREIVRTIQVYWADPIDPAASDWLTQSFDGVENIIAGQWDQADAVLVRYWEHSPREMSPFHVWRLRLARQRGDTGLVQEALRRTLPDGPATSPGDHLYFVFADLQLLAIELALDARDLDRAHQWLTANDRLLHWSGAVLGQAENRLLWGHYYWLAGDLPQALQLAEAALALASAPRQPLALIASHRLLGALAIDARRDATARQHLEHALAGAAACAAPFERALTLLEMARLQIATGNSPQTQGLIDEACTICIVLGAAPTLERITALEAILAASATSAQAFPAGLSAREVDVLRLVAEGLTDAEVAERLFLARRTINTHLTSIYTKLGVSSRAAATRFAVEHGLT